jgi:hypothetical protein
MNLSTLSALGCCPDVSSHPSGWVAAWRDGDPGLPGVVVVAASSGELSRLPVGQGPSFPKVHWPWLAYSDGAHGQLLNLETGERRDLGALFGNDPVALSSGCVAWQGADRSVYVSPLTGAWSPSRVAGAFPDGLQAVADEGSVTMVASSYGAQPGMVRWSAAAGVVVGEPAAGEKCALVRLADGREARAWTGQDCFTPRCARLADGSIGVVTWGGGSVRLALLQDADFASVAIVEDTSGVAFDFMPYFLGLLDGWPHTGSHTFDCLVDPTQKTITFVKGELPNTLEVYRYDGEALYQVRDTNGPDELPAGVSLIYHLGPVAKWMLRTAKVGTTCELHGTLQRINPDGTVQREDPFAYRTTLLRKFSAYPCGGDIGTVPVVVLQYDPNIDNPGHGAFEWGWFAYDWGCFRWQSFRAVDGALVKQTEFTRRGGKRVAPGPLVVPLSGSAPTGVAPKVHITTSYPVEISSAGRAVLVAWDDPAHPGDSGVVELVNGSVHVTLANRFGSDRSGARRPFTLRP